LPVSWHLPLLRKNNRGLHSHLLPYNLNLNYENLFFGCKGKVFFSFLQIFCVKRCKIFIFVCEPHFFAVPLQP
jgi:hypothetical protein